MLSAVVYIHRKMGRLFSWVPPMLKGLSLFLATVMRAVLTLSALLNIIVDCIFLAAVAFGVCWYCNLLPAGLTDHICAHIADLLFPNERTTP